MSMTNEERWFGYYLDELEMAGYVLDYEYQPKGIELCPESYLGEEEHPFKRFLRKEYTPDYCITWRGKALGVFIDTNKSYPFFGTAHAPMSLIDVKGSGFKFGLNNSDVTFPDRQAWIWSKYQIFVQKVEVSLQAKSIFEKTFLPQRIREEEIYTTNGKTWTKGDSKVKFKAKTLQEYEDWTQNLHEKRRGKRS